MLKNISKWDLRFLALARHISTWSKDPSTQVGAVIAKGKRIVSVGYNGFPQAVEDNDRLLDRQVKYQLIVHAEVNAILFADSNSLPNCTLYTYPFMPCPRCCGLILQSQIKNIVTLTNTNPRWTDGFRISRDMLQEAGVSLTELADTILEKK